MYASAFAKALPLKLLHEQLAYVNYNKILHLTNCLCLVKPLLP